MKNNMDMHFPDFSADLVRDIDICGIQLIDPDIRAGWKKMQDDSLSLIYSPRHGGHWMPMRACNRTDSERQYSIH